MGRIDNIITIRNASINANLFFKHYSFIKSIPCVVLYKRKSKRNIKPLRIMVKLVELHMMVLCVTIFVALVEHECANNGAFKDELAVAISQVCPPTCAKATGKKLYCCCGNSNMCAKFSPDCDADCAKKKKSCC
ncbi:hypothetical protein HanIR_Chr12g0600941 [Helianthus annuus]|nr:hypothetical protein HanIR_Chr12g0600941 [Helianthus annuus]